MIYLLLLITLIILTLLQCAFFYSLRYRGKMAKYLQLPKKSVLPQLIFGISTIVFLIIIFLLLKKLSTPQPLLSTTNSGKSMVGLPSGVTQLKHTSYTSGETYYYLYAYQDKSQQTLESVAQQIKQTFCTKPCTINFYDDTKAFQLDQERLSIIVDTVMQDWNIHNYVYVADHYLGYLSFNPYAPFSYYPYKDTYYRQRLSAK